jgi:hypothetical protein
VTISCEREALYLLGFEQEWMKSLTPGLSYIRRWKADLIRVGLRDTQPSPQCRNRRLRCVFSTLIVRAAAENPPYRTTDAKKWMSFRSSIVYCCVNRTNLLELG